MPHPQSQVLRQRREAHHKVTHLEKNIPPQESLAMVGGFHFILKIEHLYHNSLHVKVSESLRRFQKFHMCNIISKSLIINVFDSLTKLFESSYA